LRCFPLIIYLLFGSKHLTNIKDTLPGIIILA
jgi:hypothetical protein